MELKGQNGTVETYVTQSSLMQFASQGDQKCCFVIWLCMNFSVNSGKPLYVHAVNV